MKYHLHCKDCEYVGFFYPAYFGDNHVVCKYHMMHPKEGRLFAQRLEFVKECPKKEGKHGERSNQQTEGD